MWAGLEVCFGGIDLSERVYCAEPVKLGRATVFDDEARHLAKVRRIGVGDQVELFDGRGCAWPAEVEEIGKDRVELRVVGIALTDPKTRLNLTLATAVPKGERFDWLVEKASELGVTRLVPILTERSVVDPRTSKLDRLRRLAVESAKQCGRNTLLQIDPPMAWATFSAQAAKNPGASRLIAHPGGLPARAWPLPNEAILAIGPEGGFSEPEVQRAIAEGWTVISLGPTMLRVETAGLAACASVLALGEGEGVEPSWKI